MKRKNQVSSSKSRKANPIEIIIKAQSKDEKAFAELVKRFNGLVYSIVKNRLSNENIDEIVNNVFEKAFRKINTYNIAKSNFSTWLSTLTNNYCIDIYRSQKNNPTWLSLDEPHNSIYGVSHNEADVEFDNSFRIKHLNQAFQAVGEKESRLIQLRYYEDFSYNQIAEELKLPEASIGVNLKRAIEKLRKVLGDCSCL